MASSIDASTSGAGGVITTADNTGILQLKTAGTTAVTVNTTQYVGINNTSPASSLDVTGHSASNGYYNFKGYSTGRGYGSYTNSSGTVVGYIGNGGGGSMNTGAVTDFGISSAGNLLFSAGGSLNEQMRIDSSGHVIVNSASLPPSNSPSFSVLQLINEWTSMFWASSSTAAQNYGITVRYTAASPNTTTNPFYECKDSTALRGEIRSNGGLANYSANNVNLSDAREKINVELAGSYLDKICAIPVKTFNYIDQNMEDDPGLTLGVIAQDVQKIAPELIMESNWGTDDEPKNRLSIYQTDLQYALMKCIQEQQTIINDLKARVTALEAK